MSDRVSRAIPRALALPGPQQWRQWHSNVVRPYRPNGRSSLHTSLCHCNTHVDYILHVCLA